MSVGKRNEVEIGFIFNLMQGKHDRVWMWLFLHFPVLIIT